MFDYPVQKISIDLFQDVFHFPIQKVSIEKDKVSSLRWLSSKYFPIEDSSKQYSRYSKALNTNNLSFEC